MKAYYYVTKSGLHVVSMSYTVWKEIRPERPVNKYIDPI